MENVLIYEMPIKNAIIAEYDQYSEKYHILANAMAYLIYLHVGNKGK